ncbi:MAG: superoxide dismutase, partial [Acidobacteriota bacterium]
MSMVNRREAIGGILAAGAGVLVFSDQTLSQTTLSPAFAGKHQPKPLTFDAAKLKGISEKLIRSHHENNYAGAVKALNVVEQRLAALSAEKDLPPYI